MLRDSRGNQGRIRNWTGSIRFRDRSCEGIYENVNKKRNIFSIQEQIHKFEGEQCATYTNASQADLCTIIKLMNLLDPSTLQFRSDSYCVIH